MRDDARPLGCAGQRLVTANIPLARSVARPFKRAWPEHGDDFDGAAFLALCEAAATFDLGRGLKFSTFAHPRLIGACKNFLRSQVPYGYRCDPGNAPRLLTLTPDIEAEACSS